MKNLYFELQTGSKETTTNVDEAMWLIIGLEKPRNDNELIVVGERGGKDKAQSAVRFCMDAYKFQDYNKPGTDWLRDIHIKVDVTGRPYVENAGVQLIDGEWHQLDWVKDHFEADKEPLSGFDRTRDPGFVAWAEKIKDLDKRAKIFSNEKDRATKEAQRIQKHGWGRFYTYAFKIYIAHIRVWFATVYESLIESDMEKALQMRNERIQASVDSKRAYNSLKVLTPFQEPVQQEAPDAPELASELVFALVRNEKLVGEVNMFDLKPGEPFAVYQIQGGGPSRTSMNRLYWQPGNSQMVARLAEMAASKKHAVWVDPSHLQVAS